MTSGAAAASAVRAAHYAEVSNGVTRVEGRAFGFGAGFMIRDPDGHPSLLTER